MPIEFKNINGAGNFTLVNNTNSGSFILTTGTPSAPTPAPTPTSTPLNFTLEFFCGGPGGIYVGLSAYSPTGGTGIYSFSTNYFTSEAAALANTDWTPSDGRGWGAGVGDYTYWVVLKDSADNKILKSVTSNCNS